MSTNRKTAVAVGVLYIVGTVSGILSLVFSDSIQNAQDPLVSVSTNENQLAMGALIRINHGTCIGHDSSHDVSHLEKVQ